MPNVVKWAILATLIGVVVGASTAFFLNVLGLGSRMMAGQPYYFLVLPLAFLASWLVVSRWAPQYDGHGTEKIVESINRGNGEAPLVPGIVKLCATVITIASGGSAGKEDAGAQIGAAAASIIADLSSFSDSDRRMIAICGISAGFAAVFGAPLAGAVFGVEIAAVGGMFYLALLPAVISGVVGYNISLILGTAYPSYPAAVPQMFGAVPLLEAVGAGLFFGVVAFILIETLNCCRRLFEVHAVPKAAKVLLGGAAVALIGLFSTAYLGLGTIDSVLQGGGVAPYSSLLKILATSITLNFGGSGGIVTPIFFIGSTAGSLYAQALGLNLATYAEIGLVGVLAAAANAPIAAIILSIELFGPAIAPSATIACVVSFMIVGRRSVYPSQLTAKPPEARGAVEGKVRQLLHLDDN